MKNVHQELVELIARLQLLERAYTSAGHIGTQRDSASRESSPRVRIGRLMMLCGALLRNVVLPLVDAQKRAHRHVAVFGGTQVGKSTMVNVLAGQEVARVHHTAGFTRHAQAFAANGTETQILDGYPDAFPGFDRVRQDDLKLSIPNAYAVRQLERPPAVSDILWDVPDCDAVDSSMFERGMIEAATVADVVVYVTSREKYAVNVVLEWLALLLQAGTPLVGALNMTPLAQQADIVQSMEQALQRVAQRLRLQDIDAKFLTSHTVAFEYVQDADVSIFYGNDYSASIHLRRHVSELLNQGGTSRRRAVRALEFVNASMPEILAPALGEADAAGTWDKLVQLSLSEFVNEYRRGYLDDPQQYDAFNLVGIEILALLNPPIPGLQKAIGAVRTIVGLPARLLIFAGKAAWRGATSGNRKRGSSLPNEIRTFREAHTSLLNMLSREWSQEQAKSGHNCFWDALAKRWQEELSQTHKEFEEQLRAHRARSQEWIRETAHAIYTEIARNPMKLNMLRSGRISADLAAIVISIKTGGAGDIVHDLVLAPALMSAMEAISQQLAEGYVQGRRAELKARLLEDTVQFAERVYGSRLRETGRAALHDCGFVDLDESELRAMPTRLSTILQQVRNHA